MAIDRYSKDYRLIDSVDGRGHIRTETEYIGAYFAFTGDIAAARRAGRKLALLCAVGWLSFLAALYPQSRCAHALWAVLPCAFTAVPLWQLTSVAVTALRVREPFVRRDAERFSLRLPSAALFTALLTGLALLGGGLYLLLSRPGVMPGDWVFLGGNGLCLVCALLCRRLRPPLETREIS